MKRWILLLAGFALALLAAPPEERDISSLRPVELLSIYMEEDTLWVETDTGDLGGGEDLRSALEDLKATAPGEIFLDTADYVLVTEETVTFLPELKRILRPATEIVQIQERMDPQAAAEFLPVHKPGLAIKDCSTGSGLPQLTIREGRCYLDQ